ncbi:MAG: hypothetical protein LUO87_04150, partial [Methanomicrobiales archaeon]|nr:hypothetical protein [Methanomicrobiales archaeon]
GREEAVMPFKIPDFTTFKTVEISYSIKGETAQAPTACGLVIIVTTDEFARAASSGSGLIFTRPHNVLLHGEGTLNFDPRTLSEPGWMTGNYRALAYFQPANCVNEATIRIDLVMEGETPATGTPATQITTPSSPTPTGGTTGTATVGTTGVPVSPSATSSVPGPVATRARTPLESTIPVLALIAGALILARE